MTHRVPPPLARATFPPRVIEVLRTLADAGYRSYLVGGAIRDLLLHRSRARTAADFDVATPASPAQVMALFRKVIPTGIDHGTVTVLSHGEPIEVTTFRGEGAYLDGRRPESVTFLADVDGDLARRDFTMNALAFDPLSGDFRDPFDGLGDIRRRRIRAVGDPSARFGEDGLRPLRAARFAAQLGFALDPRTRAAIPGTLEVVRKVSAERVSEELSKLLAAPHVLAALRVLRSTGLLTAVLPPLASLAPAALGHAFRAAAATPPDLTLRAAALLHLIDPAEAGRLLEALRVPRRVSSEVEALLAAAPCVRRGAPELPADPRAVRRWLARVGASRAPALLEVMRADARALTGPSRRRALTAVARFGRRVQATLAERPPLEVGDLALGGKELMARLGLPAGPWVGEGLRHLLDRVLEEPSLNDPAALEKELRAWWSRRASSQVS